MRNSFHKFIFLFRAKRWSENFLNHLNRFHFHSSGISPNFKLILELNVAFVPSIELLKVLNYFLGSKIMVLRDWLLKSMSQSDDLHIINKHTMLWVKYQIINKINRNFVCFS